MELILIPLTTLITGYFTLKGVQLGLRWQMQAKQNELPTVDNPVTKIIDQKLEQAEIDKLNKTMDEYINGAKG